MLTAKELATIRAALKFWRDEISPHGNELAQHYLESTESEPLSGDEVDRLRERLLASQVRYARVDSDRMTLIDKRLHDTEPAADQGEEPIFVATILLPTA